MELMTIGEAARLLGLNASALRYYEERGLIVPTTRRGGKRMYDRTQLRKLALVQLMQQLGISLDTAAAISDSPSVNWHEHLTAQIQRLDDLILRATAARDYLTHSIGCPAEHPVQDCPTLIDVLDRRLSGATFDEIARDHDHLRGSRPARHQS
ncbi:MerR family transcriptional regulator [Streptomyces sp. NPDC002659]|uniref:MerR family transcriptional regulator n=1 Tax=Streptomyces sp. NPDC002659 TaxID=3364656 RepID=UPI0036968C2F